MIDILPAYEIPDLELVTKYYGSFKERECTKPVNTTRFIIEVEDGYVVLPVPQVGRTHENCMYRVQTVESN